MTPSPPVLTVIDLGRMAYAPALELQMRAVDRVRDARDSAEPLELLLLVEHDPPVVTVGRGGDGSNVVAPGELLAAQGIERHDASRGGDVTYHGPGQLVAYPIIDLTRHGRDVHRYLRDIEEAVIRLAADYRLEARRDDAYTGVWVGQEKLCAIGVAITRWVTYHGLALNVSTQLEHFDLIVPCGIRDRGVTSLERLLKRSVPLSEVAERLVARFAEIFGFAQVEHATAADTLDSPVHPTDQPDQ